MKLGITLLVPILALAISACSGNEQPPALAGSNQLSSSGATATTAMATATLPPTRLPASTATRVAPPSLPAATRVPAQNCDPSYPTVCIPPPPPDLDCKDIPYRRFGVLPPDPHRFDSDKDGIGCES